MVAQLESKTHPESRTIKPKQFFKKYLILLQVVLNDFRDKEATFLKSKKLEILFSFNNILQKYTFNR